MARYKVRVGKEFEVESIDVDDSRVVADAAKASRRLRDTRARHALAFFMVGAIVAALAISVAIGFFDGSYNEVSATWNAVSFPLGTIIAAYFQLRL